VILHYYTITQATESKGTATYAWRDTSKIQYYYCSAADDNHRFLISDFRSFRSLSPAPPESNLKAARAGRAIRHDPTAARVAVSSISSWKPPRGPAVRRSSRAHGATDAAAPGRREYVRIRARRSIAVSAGRPLPRRRRPPFLSGVSVRPRAFGAIRGERRRRSARFRSRRCPWRYGWGGAVGVPPSTSGLQVGHARDCSPTEPATNAARLHCQRRGGEARQARHLLHVYTALFVPACPIDQREIKESYRSYQKKKPGKKQNDKWMVGYHFAGQG